jgi:hypothetical protein
MQIVLHVFIEGECSTFCLYSLFLLRPTSRIWNYIIRSQEGASIIDPYSFHLLNEGQITDKFILQFGIV